MHHHHSPPKFENPHLRSKGATGDIFWPKQSTDQHRLKYINKSPHPLFWCDRDADKQMALDEGHQNHPKHFTPPWKLTIIRPKCSLSKTDPRTPTSTPPPQHRAALPSHLWFLSACWEYRALQTLARTCSTWKASPLCGGGCGGPASPFPENPDCSTDTRKAYPPNAYGSELAGHSVQRENRSPVTNSSKQYISFQCKSQHLWGLVLIKDVSKTFSFLLHKVSIHKGTVSS